jgi:hypothetical protein
MSESVYPLPYGPDKRTDVVFGGSDGEGGNGNEKMVIPYERGCVGVTENERREWGWGGWDI